MVSITELFSSFCPRKKLGAIYEIYVYVIHNNFIGFVFLDMKNPSVGARSTPFGAHVPTCAT